jgi:hypothetical protein
MVVMVRKPDNVTGYGQCYDKNALLKRIRCMREVYRKALVQHCKWRCQKSSNPPGEKRAEASALQLAVCTYVTARQIMWRLRHHVPFKHSANVSPRVIINHVKPLHEEFVCASIGMLVFTCSLF